MKKASNKPIIYFILILSISFVIGNIIIFGQDFLNEKYIIEAFLYIIFLLLICILLYILFKYITPSIFYSGKQEIAYDASQKVEHSGRQIASSSCGGKVGTFSFGLNLIKVIVYPGGIWIKPFTFTPLGIELDEILNITEKRTALKDIFIIEHTSNVVGSPIELNLALGDYVRESLTNLYEKHN